MLRTHYLKLDQICFFKLLKLAAVNIRDNTGELVSDEQVNLTIRKALDEVLYALVQSFYHLPGAN